MGEQGRNGTGGDTLTVPLDWWGVFMHTGLTSPDLSRPAPALPVAVFADRRDAEQMRPHYGVRAYVAKTDPPPAYHDWARATVEQSGGHIPGVTTGVTPVPVQGTSAGGGGTGEETLAELGREFPRAVDRLTPPLHEPGDTQPDLETPPTREQIRAEIRAALDSIPKVRTR
jgi:hypothetical protein